ncbi:MAG: hypothetical protein IJ444_01890 [Kiritimatiellae bacterium]|nr:hypothetical protein [Kiritimatiellia bacterium]
MATPYAKVYGRFFNKMTDFNLAELDDYTADEMLKGWLYSAIVNVRTSSDLSARNDEDEAFINDLTDNDIELLAMGMTMAWLDQYLNSTENVLQFIGGKEEKYYSQANHIAELRAMREDIRLEMKRLHSYSTYKNSSYFAD